MNEVKLFDKQIIYSIIKLIFAQEQEKAIFEMLFTLCEINFFLKCQKQIKI